MSSQPVHKSTAFIIAVIGLLLCIVGFVVLGAIIIIFDPGFNDGFEKSFISTILLGLFSLIATGAAAVGRRGFWIPLMWVSVVSNFMGLLAALTLVWFESAMDWTDEEHLLRFAIGVMLLSAAVVHTGVMWKLPGRTTGLMVMRIATSMCAWLITSVIVLTTIDENLVADLISTVFINEWIVVGLLSTAGLLCIVGTVLVPIMAISAVRRQHKSEWLRRDVKLELECPRCGTRQELGQGYSRCSECRAVVLVDIEEPRCECGYLLFELTGDTCPECGRSIDVTAPPMERAGASPPRSPIESPTAGGGSES